MTETLFAPLVEELQEEVAEHKRPIRLIAAGIAAAVALAGGGYLLLGSGGSAPTSNFVPLTHHRAPKVPTIVTKAAPPKVKLPVAYKAQIGRDPFKPLYVEPAVAPAAAAVAAPGTPVAPVTPGLPTGTGPAPGTGTAAAPGSPAGTGVTPVTPADKTYTLVLRRVYGTGKDRTAVFSIDGKQQVAKLGSKFGPTSEIVLLSMQQGPKAGQWTTVLQVGDGDPFDVVTGVPTPVR